MKRAYKCVFVVLVGLTGPIGADEPQAEKKKDPQSSFEPRSKPGDGQKFLEKFVGDWEVVKTFHPRTGKPVETKGECRQTMIHEGRFLQSEFVFGQDDKKTTGLGIIGYEAESGKFTSFWTDSRSTVHVDPPKRREVQRQPDRVVQPVAQRGRERQKKVANVDCSGG